jgi:hypothetical protein
MPFAGRCRNCNKVFWSPSKKLLLVDIHEHGAKAHKFRYEYDIWVIKRSEFKVLQQNAHNRHFWDGFNKAFSLTH